MKNLSEFLNEALNESAFEGDIVKLKKDWTIYTSGDDELFSEHDAEDTWDDIWKLFGDDDEVIIPKGSMIQFGHTTEFWRSINVYTKKVNFTGLIINYDGEEELLDISKESTNNELNEFVNKYKAKTIEANLI